MLLEIINYLDRHISAWSLKTGSIFRKTKGFKLSPYMRL